MHSGVKLKLAAADLSGMVAVPEAKVWIEGLADDLRYHTTSEANGSYLINDVPAGPHHIVTSIVVDGETMKHRSEVINVSETPMVVEAPPLTMEPAKNIVTGQLRDAEGKFLLEGTTLSLWGETFTVGKDGFFTNPPMPDSYPEAEIMVQLPLGNGFPSFKAPFVSDVVPAFLDLTVGANSEAGNNITVTNSDTLPATSSEKALLAFAFSAPDTTGSIDETSKTVLVMVPLGTDVTALKATFTASAKAVVRIGTVVQTSETTTNDFTSPVTYTVVAEDNSEQEYTVTVTKGEPELVTGIAAIAGVPQGGQTLTAGTLTPTGAAVDYQWQVSDDGSSDWTDIAGASANTYVVDLSKSAAGKYVRVVATGNGNYNGIVESNSVRIESFMDMVSVPAGTFQRDADPANISTVSPFRMSRHEITRKQFKAIMGADPSNTARSSGISDPVQEANWYHAIAFCNKLSLGEGLTPAYSVSGVDFSTLIYSDIPTSTDANWNAATCDWSANGYRLPTEMEWMWAAMGADKDDPGATNTTGYTKAFAGSAGSIDDNAWYANNSGYRTRPAGTKNANELGLYDMSGNVWEWCWDWYRTYPAGAEIDYKGVDSASYRILRGGSWLNNPGILTVAFRYYPDPYYQNISIGFRVVRF